MKRIAVMISVVVALSGAVCASEVDSDFEPWGKLELSMGMFLSAVGSDVRIGSGFGLDIDVEEPLGMVVTNFVFRANASWRFTKNRIHRLEFLWFSLHRTGDRSVLQDFEYEDINGDTVYVKAGTQAASLFNLNIYKVSYNYSFFQGDNSTLPQRSACLSCRSSSGSRPPVRSRRNSIRRLLPPSPRSACIAISQLRHGGFSGSGQSSSI